MAKDANGAEITVGDSVSWSAEGYKQYERYWPQMEEGDKKVIIIDERGVGVDFGQVGIGDGKGASNDLGGLLATNTGYVLAGSAFIIVTNPKAVISQDDDEEAVIEKLTLAVKAEPVAFMDGKYYTLQLQENKTADELSERLIKLASDKIVEGKKSADRAIKKAQQEAHSKLLLPAISLKDIQEGVRVYKNKGNGLGVLLPFKFRPKYIGAPGDISGGKEVKVINAKTQAKLAHDILYQAEFHANGEPSSIELVRPDTLSIFDQYNGNCQGSVGLPKTVSWADIISHRDRAEHVYEGIHISHRDRDNPRGLPSWDDLLKNCTRKNNIGRWQKNKAKGDELVEGELAVGRIVKILDFYENLPKKYVGVKAKIVRLIDVNSPAPAVGVEFLEREAQFHSSANTGKQGFCYNITINKVELQPIGAVRSRVANKEGVGGRDKPRKPFGEILEAAQNLKISKDDAEWPR